MNGWNQHISQWSGLCQGISCPASLCSVFFHSLVFWQINPGLSIIEDLPKETSQQGGNQKNFGWVATFLRCHGLTSEGLWGSPMPTLDSHLPPGSASDLLPCAPYLAFQGCLSEMISPMRAIWYINPQSSSSECKLVTLRIGVLFIDRVMASPGYDPRGTLAWKQDL